jgi:carboxymethylenebutenolidase
MGSNITLTSADGFQFSAYQAEAEGPTRGAVVVVQEIFGVNSHIRSVVDRYAAAGYLAIAPALFDRIQPGIELGYTPEDMGQGSGYARQQLKFDAALADCVAAGRAVSTAGKVGVVGYCFGGLITAALAIQAGDVFSAAASYYGGGTIDLVGSGIPAIPMVAHYGALDGYIPVTDVATISAAWPDVQVYTYDADHGFNCDARGSFSAVPAAIAQARTFRLFDQHIG